MLKGRLLKGMARATRVARLPIGRGGRAHIVAAGVNRAVLYGVGVTGISDSDLRKWRSAVVQAVAPGRAARTCTRATLVLAAKQEVDPEVLVPSEVVGTWARMVWGLERVPDEAGDALGRYPEAWKGGDPERRPCQDQWTHGGLVPGCRADGMDH